MVYVMTNPDLIGTMRDLAAKEGVQIQIQKDGLVVWVNIDGICVLRVMVTPAAVIKIEDGRK